MRLILNDHRVVKDCFVFVNSQDSTVEQRVRVFMKFFYSAVLMAGCCEEERLSRLVGNFSRSASERAHYLFFLNSSLLYFAANCMEKQAIFCAKVCAILQQIA